MAFYFSSLLLIFYIVFIINLGLVIKDSLKILEGSNLLYYPVAKRIKLVYVVLILLIPVIFCILFLWKSYILSMFITLLSMMGLMDIILTIEKLNVKKVNSLVLLYVIYTLISIITYWIYLI